AGALLGGFLTSCRSVVNPVGSIWSVGVSDFRRRDRCGERCERADRGWRRRKLGHRISQSATVSDRLIVRVCVTDPRHALFGQRFDLSPSSEPRPGWVSVLLADGRRRWLPRTATDLDLACETMPNHALPRVSVRTLLPLARYVEALLCNSSKTADGAPPSDDR